MIYCPSSRMTDMCNRSGLDTISAGSVIAFAMECYEKGIVSKADTDGIEMTWGNADAMIAMLDKIVRREGFGDILADGVKIAAKKIGKGAEEFAIHVGGQEPGLHNALFLPGRGTGFCGRSHTGSSHRITHGKARWGPPQPSHLIRSCISKILSVTNTDPKAGPVQPPRATIKSAAAQGPVSFR